MNVTAKTTTSKSGKGNTVNFMKITNLKEIIHYSKEEKPCY